MGIEWDIQPTLWEGLLIPFETSTPAYMEVGEVYSWTSADGLAVVSVWNLHENPWYSAKTGFTQSQVSPKIDGIWTYLALGHMGKNWNITIFEWKSMENHQSRTPSMITSSLSHQVLLSSLLAWPRRPSIMKFKRAVDLIRKAPTCERHDDSSIPNMKYHEIIPKQKPGLAPGSI